MDTSDLITRAPFFFFFFRSKVTQGMDDDNAWQTVVDQQIAAFPIRWMMNDDGGPPEEPRLATHRPSA